jgi:cytochrome P450
VGGKNPTAHGKSTSPQESTYIAQGMTTHKTNKHFSQDQWSIIGRAIRKNAEHSEETGNTEEETTKKTPSTTSFSEILSSTTLPASDKSQQRLADEAQILVAAGVETTAFALSVGIFHIVNTPHIRRLLQDELFAAFPLGYKTMPSLHELEKLPYLRACIQESLRLS